MKLEDMSIEQIRELAKRQEGELMEQTEIAQAANRQTEASRLAIATPFAFVIVNEQGGAEFATNTHDEAQAHINDAISEHDIEGAGKWRSIPAHEMRPSDDKLWDQTMRERDYNAEIADKLADAIGEYFGADIGEHSSANCPWLSALNVIEEAAPQQHAQAALSDTIEFIMRDVAELEYTGLEDDTMKVTPEDLQLIFERHIATRQPAPTEKQLQAVRQSSFDAGRSYGELGTPVSAAVEQEVSCLNFPDDHKDLTITATHWSCLDCGDSWPIKSNRAAQPSISQGDVLSQDAGGATHCEVPFEHAAQISTRKSYIAGFHAALAQRAASETGRPAYIDANGATRCTSCQANHDLNQDHAEDCEVGAEERAAALREVHAFLLGEGELCHMWFGMKQAGQGEYWWRNNLRAAMAAQQGDKP